MKTKTALVFPGQGSQVVGMGKDLSENFQSAREVFFTVDEILKKNLSKIMFEGDASELTKTENAQPALMAVSIAIIKILEKEFGKKVEEMCDFVAGHSLGEYSALCAAKALTLEDTAKLLYVRGSEMSKCGEKTAGSMAAILGAEIPLIEEIVKEAAQGEVCQIANDNSVGQIVISGSLNAILRAIEIAKTKGVKRAIQLPVSGAFHSQLMADARSEMVKALQNIEIKSPIVPVIANVTAQKTSDPSEIKKLLADQITASVKWRETMLLLEGEGVTKIIEIGSGKVLSGLVGRTCNSVEALSIQNASDIKSFTS